MKATRRAVCVSGGDGLKSNCRRLNPNPNPDPDLHSDPKLNRNPNPDREPNRDSNPNRNPNRNPRGGSGWQGMCVWWWWGSGFTNLQHAEIGATKIQSVTNA